MHIDRSMNFSECIDAIKVIFIESYYYFYYFRNIIIFSSFFLLIFKVSYTDLY
jgi:hypothetical protein